MYSCSRRAALSWPASAARNGCLDSNASALERTASTSATSSQAVENAASRSSACRRWGLEISPSRVRRSIALVTSVRDHSQVTIDRSSDNHVRTNSLSGSTTTSGTSADASQYLTADLICPRTTHPGCSPATPTEVLPKCPRQIRYPAATPLGQSIALGHPDRPPAPEGPASQRVCHYQEPEPRPRYEPLAGSGSGPPSIRKPISCS